jgi:hypothetical protein
MKKIYMSILDLFVRYTFHRLELADRDHARSGRQFIKRCQAQSYGASDGMREDWYIFNGEPPPAAAERFVPEPENFPASVGVHSPMTE